MDEINLLNEGISAVIICFNEQKTIVSTLNSLDGLVDETVIVDTGSTDNTMGLILQHPLKTRLYSCPWNNDFSEVRNYSISLTQNPWCLVIDADECIASESRLSFRSTLRGIIDTDKNALYAPLIDNLDGSQLTNSPRFFRKRSSLRYHGKVHEYLIEDEESQIIYLPAIKFLHYGYTNEAWKAKNKYIRNKTLLQQQRLSEPNNLRWEYFSLRYLKPEDPDYQEILKHFGALPLPYAPEWEVYAFNVKSRLIISLLQRGSYQQAWQHMHSLYEFYKDKDTSLLYLVTNYLYSKNTLIERAQQSDRLLQTLQNLQHDKYLSENLAPDNVQEILDEISLVAKKITTECFLL